MIIMLIIICSVVADWYVMLFSHLLDNIIKTNFYLLCQLLIKIKNAMSVFSLMINVQLKQLCQL